MKNNFLIFILFVFFSNSIFSQEINFSKNKPLKIGLALSGGGAKGYAHIGVLKVLEKAGIKIDYISGTSIGAIIGALYASGYSADELEQIVKENDFSEILFNLNSKKFISFFNKKQGEKHVFQLPLKKFELKLPNSLFNSQNIYDFFSNLLYKVKHIEDFSKLPISFLCVATELESGNAVALKKGDLVKSILASAALPSLISPIKFKDKVYIDGGVVSNLPVNELKAEGTSFIIAVDVSSDNNPEVKQQENMPLAEVINQLTSYRWKNLKENQLKNATILIKPDIKNFSVLSFDQKNVLIKKGETAAMKYLDKLKEVATFQNNSFLKKDKKKFNYLADKISLEDIRLEGLNAKETEYTLNKVGLNLKNITAAHIKKTIKKIKKDEDFSHLFYNIKTIAPSKYSLFVDVYKSPYKSFVNFGFHHDYIFKTSILFNYTLKKALFLKDILSIDFILGENYRGNFDYYIDKGWFGFGLHSNFMQYNSFHLRSQKEDVSIIKKLTIKNYDFIQQFYSQLNFSNQSVFGAGIQYHFFRRKGQVFTPSKYEWHTHNIGPYAYLTIDKLDNPNFPRKGFFLDIKNKIHIPFNGSFSTTKNGVFLKEEKYQELKIDQLETDFEFNIPVGFISFRGKFSMGLSFIETSSYPSNEDSNKFLPRMQYFLGGVNKQNLFNYKPFYGYPFFSIYGWNKFLLGGEIQLKILKNHYFTFAYNIAALVESLSNLEAMKRHKGFLFSYGYDSLVGPLEFFFNYSPDKKIGEKTWYVSLGFMF